MLANGLIFLFMVGVLGWVGLFSRALVKPNDRDIEICDERGKFQCLRIGICLELKDCTD